MRTKTLLLTAVLGIASAASSMAQAVYSVNVVGYVNLTLKRGFNAVANAPRGVDSYTEKLGYRRKAWIELAGCLLFALPYTLVLVWYGWDFVRIAWEFNERSDAALGLPYRWVIKGVMYLGLWLLLLGIVSVLLRLIAFLFFRQEANLKIGASASQV